MKSISRITEKQKNLNFGYKKEVYLFLFGLLVMIFHSDQVEWAKSTLKNLKIGPKFIKKS